jgi:hypothetical protein
MTLKGAVKMEMDRYTKDLELIFKGDKFALYVNRESNEVSVLSYAEDDICTIPLNGLGKILFER